MLAVQTFSHAGAMLSLILLRSVVSALHIACIRCISLVDSLLDSTCPSCRSSCSCCCSRSYVLISIPPSLKTNQHNARPVPKLFWGRCEVSIDID